MALFYCLCYEAYRPYQSIDTSPFGPQMFIGQIINFTVGESLYHPSSLPVFFYLAFYFKRFGYACWFYRLISIAWHIIFKFLCALWNRKLLFLFSDHHHHQHGHTIEMERISNKMPKISLVKLICNLSWGRDKICQMLMTDPQNAQPQSGQTQSGRNKFHWRICHITQWISCCP